MQPVFIIEDAALYRFEKQASIFCPFRPRKGQSRKSCGWNVLVWQNKIATVEDNDLKWVLLCQKGDVEAFGILVERYQKKMLNVAYRMTGDYEESCEVVQDAFLAAFRTIKKFRGEARFSTWLYGIVINSTKNRLKQLKRDKSRFWHAGDNPGDPSDGAIDGFDCLGHPDQANRNPFSNILKKRNWRPGCRNASACWRATTGKS
jgi:RNA polymerase sigma-70 factor (ECF subfamily)